MEMTRTEIKQFIKEAESLLEPLKEKYGVNLDFGNTRFSSEGLTTKLEVLNVVGSLEDTLKEKYKKNAVLSGDQRVIEAFGKEVRIGSKELKVVGYNTRAPKNPIELEGKNGGKYKCPVNQLLMVLN